ncbi:MAG TPA: MFS transporter, partial [Reyranellaceae bacterium]|nr:MFS transporter [Reyranellaceae bacterium]
MTVAATSGRWPLLRWFAASATLPVPQAAGPVAFSLVALSVIGETSGGAAMMLAMTLAQVAGAIPITRLGRKLPGATFLRLLVAFRTVALGAVALCAHYQVPFAWFVVLAALAGAVNGAAFGYLRSLLNHFAAAGRLPRALGISTTLNELTFVLAPVAAAGLGSISPVLGIAAVTALGALPALLVPAAGNTPVEDLRPARASVLTPAILLWLACAAAGGSTVAAIEIGAVALALKFGYEPA